MNKFSPTSLDTYLSCPRKYYYIYVALIEPIARKVDFAFGTAIHAAVAEWYKSKDKIKAVKAFADSWVAQKVKGTQKKNLEVGILVVGKYCEAYANDNSIFDPKLIECRTKIEMPNGTILSGIIDRVKREENYIAVVDTKTSSWPLTDYWFNGQENAFPIGAYEYIYSFTDI